MFALVLAGYGIRCILEILCLPFVIVAFLRGPKK